LEDKENNKGVAVNDSSDLKDTEYVSNEHLNQFEDDYDIDDVFVDDDMILKSLLNIDNGTTVLLNRVKQNCNSCKVI